MTSRFWRQLGAEHAAKLDAHGFESVKRVQALRYFNWRWTLRRAIGGEQGRYLLTHSSFRSWMRALATPATLSDAAWTPAMWPRRDRWIYIIATRLIWDIAMRLGSRHVLELPEPALGAPFPVRWRGRLISQDLANTALEMASIEEALGGRVPSSIIEIGAGYGRTAYAMLSRYPTVSYTIIDISPALDISRWYLTTLFPERDIEFLDAAHYDRITAPFDLAVSISSLQEMSHEQVRGYLGLLDRLARPGAVTYLKQWERWWNPIDEIEQTTANYVLPPRWRRLFSRQCPIQTTFTEIAWTAD